MVSRVFLVAAASLVLQASLVLTGCATSARDADASGPPAPIDPRGVPIFDGHTGSPVNWDSMLEAALAADVIIIGELHGHEQGLATAAALWEDVLDATLGATPGPALSMEFFERDEQAALDDYLMGVTDDAAFRAATGRTDRNYPPGHRQMIESAKGLGVPVYASNAPRRYSSLAREDGYDAVRALRPSQRALVEAPASSPTGPYRERFIEDMRGMLASHGGEEELGEAELDGRLEGYFRAQSVWDETMADTIARALRGGHRPVVHVVGRFHAARDGGLVTAVWRRHPGARIVTVSMVEGEAEEDAPPSDLVVDVGGGGDAGV